MAIRERIEAKTRALKASWTTPAKTLQEQSLDVLKYEETLANMPEDHPDREDLIKLIAWEKKYFDDIWKEKGQMSW